MKKSAKAARDAEHTLFPPSFFRPKLYGIVAVVCVLAAIGAFLVFRYVDVDLARDMRNWQDRLNIIADGREAAVSDWVDGQLKELKKMAENPSLQLYFAEIKSHEMPAGTAQQPVDMQGEPAQKTYLRNLLSFTADQMGVSPQAPLSAQIPADVPFTATTGIAIVDPSGNIMVSTPYLTALDAHIIDQLKKIPPAASAVIDIYKTNDGKLQMGFVTPVFAIQADADSFPIGRAVAMKTVDDNFYQLLKHLGGTEKTLEAELVRLDNGNITYLSPSADGSAPLEKSLAEDTPKLAAAFALQNPGSFGEGLDYASHHVLVTGRAIAQTPWTLVLKIDRAEALKEGSLRRNGMVMALVLIVAVVVAVVVAVWHSASSRRALFASRYFRDLAERATAQERLLKLVTDNQPEAIYIVDHTQHYRFANRQAAQAAFMPPEDMQGKRVGDVLGAARAQSTTEAVSDTLTHQHVHARFTRFHVQGQEKVIKTDYIPLAHIPVPGLAENTPGVLVVEQDISDAVHERERRIGAQRQLIDTLVMMVDKRDPNAAHHSIRVAEIAHRVAQAMELEPMLVEATRLAGSLMNIGKIIIPAHVLTKRESLNEDELKSIRDSMMASAELLKEVTFDGPVVETLREAQERWDGAGPLGLSEEKILISARIIAAVNAFVGMISPRSYRAAMTADSALDILFTKVDKQFDRKVVIALAHYMDNGGGRARLEKGQGE